MKKRSNVFRQSVINVYPWAKCELRPTGKRYYQVINRVERSSLYDS